MKVAQVVSILEAIAPPHLAEDWDNVGLLIGDTTAPAGGLMLCIDLTAAVLKEAITSRCGMVMAYHPVIFKPIARLTAGSTGVAYAAARAGISVYSMHTALDAAPGGTNDALADAAGIIRRRPIEPRVRKGQCKIVVFLPPADLHRVAEAAFAAGAGRIGNYDRCAFWGEGVGTFVGGSGTHPAVGSPGRQEVVHEVRLELLAPCRLAPAICDAIRAAHSYEEPALDVYPVEDYPQGVGMGRIGELEHSITPAALVARLKRAAGLRRVAVVQPASGARMPRKLATIACGAGSCGDMYKAAAAQGAQAFITGEMRHHDALAAAEMGLMAICLGHSNSERLALGGLRKRLIEELPGLRVVLAGADRDPSQIE
jgi:dinuclear metal center YbgI/SA1388 family protein